MGKDQAVPENVKKFQDMTNSSWLMETNGKSIRIAENAAKIISGDCKTIAIKEMLVGEQRKTWRIVNTADGNTILLLSSRELK